MKLVLLKVKLQGSHTKALSLYIFKDSELESRHRRIGLLHHDIDLLTLMNLGPFVLNYVFRVNLRNLVQLLYKVLPSMLIILHITYASQWEFVT